jgi:hypothetical protein
MKRRKNFDPGGRQLDREQTINREQISLMAGALSIDLELVCRGCPLWEQRNCRTRRQQSRSGRESAALAAQEIHVPYT